MSQSKFREQNIAIANILAASTPHSSDIDPHAGTYLAMFGS